MEHYTFQLMGVGSSACATKHKGSVVILPNFSKNKHARFCESITIFLKKNIFITYKYIFLFVCLLWKPLFKSISLTSTTVNHF